MRKSEDIEDEIEEALEPKMLKKLSSEDKKRKEKDHMAKEGSQITKDEDEEVIIVGWGTYWKYYSEAYYWAIILFICWPLM